MYQRYKERFGTAGVALGVIALILALGGTALAAKGALTGKQKKEVEKIAKKYAGKPGAPGAAGTAGTNGTNGKDGTNGTNGAPGAPGADGKSVEAGPAGSKCPEGGTKFSIGGVEVGKACNGPEGPEGPEGKPWTPDNVLPSDATETGAWVFSPISAGEIPENNQVETVISFTLPLAAEIAEANVHYEPVGYTGTTGADCPGSATAPAAKAGHLCVYAGQSEGTIEPGAKSIVKLDSPFAQGVAVAGASTSGAALLFEMEAGARLRGSWAVTAP